MSKLIFFDLDGTLVDYHGHIPDSAKKAIQLAQTNGHKIFVCTGRSMCQLTDDILSLGFDGFVAATGAYVSYKNKIIFRHAMAHDLLEKLDYFTRLYHGITVYQTTSSFYIHESLYERAFQHFLQIGMKETRLKEFTAIIKTYSDSILNSEKADQIEKAFYFDSEASVAKFQEILPKEICVIGSSFSDKSEDGAGEFTTAKITKSYGMQKLLDYLGYTSKDTIAFGDGPNDLDMISFAGTGVVMGNGRKELKELADLITTDVDQDGVYNGMKQLGLF